MGDDDRAQPFSNFFFFFIFACLLVIVWLESLLCWLTIIAEWDGLMSHSGPHDRHDSASLSALSFHVRLLKAKLCYLVKCLTRRPIYVWSLWCMFVHRKQQNSLHYQTFLLFNRSEFESWNNEISSRSYEGKLHFKWRMKLRERNS